MSVDDHVHAAGRGARVARAAVPQAVLEHRRTLGEVPLQTLVEQCRLVETRDAGRDDSGGDVSPYGDWYWVVGRYRIEQA